MANIQPRYDKSGKLISYSIRVFRGRGADGKQLKPWTETFGVEPGWTEKSARKKAEARAAVFEKECKEGTASDSRRRFDEYFDYVISLKEARGKKHSTIVWYKEHRDIINAEIGHIKLKNLRVDDLNRLYTKLSKTTIKAKSAKSSIDLSDMLKTQHITQTSIAKGTGLSENTVRIAVHGDSCSVETAKKISDYLGLKFEKSFFVLTENKNLSGKTISGYHRVISAVLQQAVKEGLISINVAAKADIPKIDKKEVNSLQSADLPAILAALDREPLRWRVIVHLLLITGCRRGEILGLKWSAVDFDENRLHICNNVLYTPDRGVYQDTPKTESSVRWITVPDETIDLLREWKKKQDADAKEKGTFYQNPEGLLFTQDNGLPMNPDSVTTWLARFSKKYNLPHIHPHLFRHTMASILIFNHVDPVSVSKRLGHTQVSTTTDIYSHVIKEAGKQNANILASVFLKQA